MPYILPEKREELEVGEYQAYFFEAATPGELNYLFTKCAQAYLTQRGRSYQTINDILGALEGAKLEFVRRVVNPFEDEKIRVNGDIY